MYKSVCDRDAFRADAHGLPQKARVHIKRDADSILELTHTDPPYLWISNDQISLAIQSAFNHIKSKHMKMFFGDARVWGHVHNSAGKSDPHFSNHSAYSNPSRIQERIYKLLDDSDTKYFFWFYNTIDSDPNADGSHWVTCLLVISGKRTKNTNYKIYYFDPFGQPPSQQLMEEIQSMQTTFSQYIAHKKQQHFEPRKIEKQTFYYYGQNGEPKLQKDYWQCGVWCIWFVHNCLKYSMAAPYKRKDDGEIMFKYVTLGAPIPHRKARTDELEFRKGYFMHDSSDQGKVGCSQDSQYSIELEYEDKEQKGGCSHDPVDLDEDDEV